MEQACVGAESPEELLNKALNIFLNRWRVEAVTPGELLHKGKFAIANLGAEEVAPFFFRSDISLITVHISLLPIPSAIERVLYATANVINSSELRAEERTNSAEAQALNV